MESKQATRITVHDFLADKNSAAGHFAATDGQQLPPFFTLHQTSIFEGVAFGVCLQGSARVRINSKVYEVNDHTIITVVPNHIIEPLRKSDDFLIELLVFSLDFASDLPLDISAVKAVGRMPCLQVGDRDKELLRTFHQLIVQWYGQQEYILRQEVAKGLLYVLSLQVAAIYEKADVEIKHIATSRQEELTEKFLKLLVAHYAEERSPAFYASKLCVATKYLSQVVKEVTGDTSFAWINKLVIIGAKHRIKTSGRTIAQISEDMNFPNPSFFGRFFKKHTGVTPLKYKSAMKYEV
jgi:AraC-like DNA-binding protein